jgi:hypothetical protein
VRVAEFEKVKHWTSVQLDPIAGSNDWANGAQARRNR